MELERDMGEAIFWTRKISTSRASFSQSLSESEPDVSECGVFLSNEIIDLAME